MQEIAHPLVRGIDLLSETHTAWLSHDGPHMSNRCAVPRLVSHELSIDEPRIICAEAAPVFLPFVM
jgi:hypothetical protein